MNVNINHLEIATTSSGHFKFTVTVTPPADEDVKKYSYKTPWFPATEEDDCVLYKRQRHHYTRSFYLTRAEVSHILKILRNEAEFNPYFADGTHLMQFYRTGIREQYISGSSSETFWMEFPVTELMDDLVAILALSTTARVTYTYDYDVCRAWRDKYSPRYTWNFIDYSYLENYPAMWTKLQEDKADTRAVNLVRCLESLENIAKNYSDGETVVINLSFDGRPTKGEPANYYFSINDADGKRIMNGGIVAHRVENGWEYATHT